MKRFFRSFFQSLSCLVGFVAHVIILLSFLPMLPLPAGTWIRPMGWAMLVFCIALFTFPVGIIMVITDAINGKRRLALLGFVLCSIPFVSASLLLEALAMLKGLHIAE
jgi:hypothetical protein